MIKNTYFILFFTVLLITLSSCEKEEEENNNPTSGCIDSEACNYDSNATEDDGSCEYTSCAGCMNAEAENYDPNAIIDDGSCIILGCTDESAINYNPNATNDDNSCKYSVASMLHGDWNISFLDYETEVDLSFLTDLIGFDLGSQDISGQAEDAGTWSLNSENYTYSSELDFDTEPFTILTFEVPGIPFEYENSGSWELTNNDNDLILTDELTGEQAEYEIIGDITENSVFMVGTISVTQDVMGTDLVFDIDVQMQLEKFSN